MNSVLLMGVKAVAKQLHKTCTTLFISLGLYTQKSINVALATILNTAIQNLSNYFTNLIHSQFLENNSLYNVFLHTLHRSYGYYELNTLNTNEGTN